jgi:hypothetical protein
VHKRSPAFSVAAGKTSVVADVISVRVKLPMAAGSGRTPAAVVFSVMADVIPVLLTTQSSDRP